MGELLNPTVSTTIEGLKVHVIQTGEPVLVPVLRPETIRQIIGEHECQLYIEHIKVYSLLIVPLRVPGRVIGTVGVTRRTPDTPYTLEDQTFLQDVSDQAALAIVNADLHRTLQQELAERKQIEHVLRDMQGNLERRVEQRTKELSIINEKLRQEIGERTRIEEALRESEARYRLLAEYATDLISRATIEGINLYISPACRTMLGYEAYEITGHSCYTFLHPEDREHVQAVHTWLAHNTATDSYTVQYRFRCKDDSYVWLETISTLLYNQRTGTAQEIISVSRNITERKQAEEEIRRLNAVLQHQAHELEATTHELEAFSHSISHELRAPLRAIEGFSRMLYASDIVLPSDARHMVSRIQANTEHMQRLIDNLLTFARFNRHPLTRADVDLSRLVQQVYDELQPEYQGRQIEFIVGPLPTCQSDPVLLKQVFANMLSNALKFTRPRDVARIEVGVQPTPDGSVYFVRDNGVGFDMRYASRLFNVFQRLHTTDEYEGTGIGLSIVQRIIHRHGGRIWVESERNSGTTFYFTL
jgi:PAS domain S-box-containing protein